MKRANPILEFNDREVNMPFEIHAMEWIEKNRKDRNDQPHRHDYYTIIWVKQGSGIHLLDLDRFDIEGNTIYCISPGQVHLLSVEGPVDGYVISFTADFIGHSAENFALLFESGIFNTYGQTKLIHPSDDCREDMEETIGKMMKEFDNYYLLRAEILRGYLHIFLIYLKRHLGKSGRETDQSKHYETVRQFFALIEKYYRTEKMVSEYAARLVVTPNYLNELVKKVTGHPASYHIQQRVVLESKRLLAFSRLSMKEIAYELGFEDSAHFSKYFRKVSGQNFSAYKELIRKAGESDGGKQ